MGGRTKGEGKGAPASGLQASIAPRRDAMSCALLGDDQLRIMVGQSAEGGRLRAACTMTRVCDVTDRSLRDGDRTSRRSQSSRRTRHCISGDVG